MDESVEFALQKLGTIDIAVLNASVAWLGYFENFNSTN